MKYIRYSPKKFLDNYRNRPNPRQMNYSPYEFILLNYIKNNN